MAHYALDNVPGGKATLVTNHRIVAKPPPMTASPHVHSPPSRSLDSASSAQLSELRRRAGIVLCFALCFYLYMHSLTHSLTLYRMLVVL
jgi:hypothetical protein